jgi:hypothetical protein
MSTRTYYPRLADKYKKEVVPALVKKFGYAGSEAEEDLLEPWCERCCV